eukprot:1173433-Prorocentrum_minimum.AAC.1
MYGISPNTQASKGAFDLSTRAFMNAMTSSENTEVSRWVSNTILWARWLKLACSSCVSSRNMSTPTMFVGCLLVAPCGGGKESPHVPKPAHTNGVTYVGYFAVATRFDV